MNNAKLFYYANESGPAAYRNEKFAKWVQSLEGNAKIVGFLALKAGELDQITGDDSEFVTGSEDSEENGILFFAETEDA